MTDTLRHAPHRSREGRFAIAIDFGRLQEWLRVHLSRWPRSRKLRGPTTERSVPTGSGRRLAFARNGLHLPGPGFLSDREENEIDFTSTPREVARDSKVHSREQHPVGCGDHCRCDPRRTADADPGSAPLTGVDRLPGRGAGFLQEWLQPLNASARHDQVTGHLLATARIADLQLRDSRKSPPLNRSAE